MLSQDSKVKGKLSLPLLDAPVTVRMRFRKVGNLQYISHLDLQRTFSHVLMRADIPTWYTKGFNPHPKIVFATPLSVGSESVCELVDVRIDREISHEAILRQMNAQLTDELCLLEVYTPDSKFSDIAWAAYEITLTSPALVAQDVARVRTLLSSSPLTVLKHSKSGEREVDIADRIGAYDVAFADGSLTLSVVLSASPDRYIGPEYIVGLLRDRLGLMTGDPKEERYRILRTRVLLADGRTEFR